MPDFTKMLCNILAGIVIGAGVASAAEPMPTFSNVSVHDPSVIKVGDRFYVFGSHGASAWTEDLMNWTQFASSVNAGNPPHFSTFQSELSELIAWTGSNTLWAADVIQLPDGKFYYYYNVWTDLSGYRSYMGVAVADDIEGPYADRGEILKGGTGVAGFNASVHPNTIDPDVFFDQAGRLWMVYGSYSGGIFILELDSATGFPSPGQGYGKKLIGGNHARIEGAYIIYSPESEYYYLFMSFGGLDAVGGYNIRLGRSRNPDGPYLDAAGTDLVNVAGAPGTLFDDVSIAPHGVKLMGGFQFVNATGEPGSASRGYVSPGHNSAYYDPETGKHLLFFHTRFVGLGEVHEVRVHQMFVTADEWLVVAPHRYAQETIEATDPARIPGNYRFINHGKAITATVTSSSSLTLHPDGSVTGTSNGTWQLSGDYDATLMLDGTSYRGVFVDQWDQGNQSWVLAFTALSNDGVAVWGSKVAIDAAPAIVTQPAGQDVVAGSRVTLSVAATADPGPAYQWRKDGADIDGATGASFTIAKARADDAGSYTVVITNPAGSVTSNAASLDVTVPPFISAHPASLTQVPSTAASLTVTASGTGTVSYQWFKDGDAIPGETGNTLALSALEIDDAGDYSVRVSDSVGSTTSRLARIVVANPVEGRISNLSVRSIAGFGGQPLIVGFVMTDGEKDVLVRAVGPALASFGVGGTMDNPTLTMHALVDGTDAIVASNDNWGDGGNAAALASVFSSVGAFPFPEAGSKDAALVTAVDGSRTVHVASGLPAQDGVVLVETYDMNPAEGARLANVSARNFAGVGSQTLIAGFVIDGNVPKRVLIRGVGPTLSDFGVQEAIEDPRLEIFTTIEGQDRVVASNDDWAEEPAVADSSAAAGAFALRDQSGDAAIVMTLPAGAYTAHVSGFGATTGEALVEIYEIP